MIWRGFAINNNLIKVSTAKAVLINLPSGSQYKGYSFWHPRKLVKAGSMSMVLYTDDFVFRLKKYGQGRFNQREILHEIELSASDMVEAFSMIHTPDAEIPLMHKPEQLQPIECNPLEELLDE